MELPLVVWFDELRKCQDVLTDGTAEIEFRRALQIIQESRLDWQESAAEVQRLQRELDRMQCLYDECIQEHLDLQTKLLHAHRFLESEIKVRRELEEQLSIIWNYLHNDRNDMNNEIRDLLTLSRSSLKRKSESNRQETQDNEINSTLSFLSDLSINHIKDIFPNVVKPLKKHRQSATRNGSPYNNENGQRQRISRISKKSRNRKNTTEFEKDVSEKIVATTKISFPQDYGPIEATSTIEAVTNSVQYNQFQSIVTETEEDDRKSENSITTSRTKILSIEKEQPLPIEQQRHETVNCFGPNMFFNFKSREHKFSSRIIFWSECCRNCSKKFRFGASAFRCSFCGVYLHNKCKNQFTMGCVPKVRRKVHNKQRGRITDYVPSESPMIPPLIVYCINEIDRRGLSNKGIYRKSGSDKAIRALKRRILRGKRAPMLTNSDIHVICGCIKDFLRCLKEPLIPTDLWITFSNAVQLIHDVDIQHALAAVIIILPQANRDTLAFLILHLQRVANCNATQMPISNLAKIFGPTIVGYSCADPDHHAILSETLVQKDVMENLLKMPANYWFRFISRQLTETDCQNTLK